MSSIWFKSSTSKIFLRALCGVKLISLETWVDNLIRSYLPMLCFLQIASTSTWSILFWLWLITNFIYINLVSKPESRSTELIKSLLQSCVFELWRVTPSISWQEPERCQPTNWVKHIHFLHFSGIQGGSSNRMTFSGQRD